ncbi:MAG: hypothetical protein LC808_14370 [Actinobacteria bacterium]|nr:hypothetical protein [Actinomycetota bacterium]
MVTPFRWHTRKPPEFGISDEAFLSQEAFPKGKLDYPAEGRTTPALRFLLADARQRGAGVNVERPQPKARTNDVDAGDERRRIDQEAWGMISLLGLGTQG